MINALGEDVRWTDPHRHKYGDAMAEYLDSGGYDADDETGSVEYAYHVRRFGKRLVNKDGSGFVGCSKYPTEQDAIDAIEAYAENYGRWLDDEDGDDEDGYDDEPQPAQLRGDKYETPWCPVHNRPHIWGSFACEITSSENWGGIK